MQNSSRRLSVRLRIAASVLLVSILAVAVAVGTHSAFTGTDSNSGNSVSSAQVSLGDNSATTALFNLIGNLVPGVLNGVTRCIQVTYTGTAPNGVNVKLYASNNTTGLGPNLNFEIIRGSFSSTPSAGSCTGFVADTANYGLGAGGIIYDSTLGSFNGSSAPLADPVGTWTNNTKVGYEFITSVVDTNAAQNQTVAPTFTWVASNN